MEPPHDIESGRITECKSIDDDNVAEFSGQDESQQQIPGPFRIQENQSGSESQIPTAMSIRETTEVMDAQAHGQSSHRTGNVAPSAPNDQSNFQSQDKNTDICEQNALRKSSEGWSKLSSNLKKYDEDRIKRVDSDMDNLLVFTGLFSAVVTAFCIEFYKSLQPDPKETSETLLLQMLKQLASLNPNGLTLNSSALAAEQPISTSMRRSKTSVYINIFWFLSLVFSLTTASLVILVKQWLSEYIAYDTNLPSQSYIRVRHFRSEGMEKFRVFEIAAALPMLLQIALGLFFIGLAIFLIDLDLTVGWSITPFIILWAFLFIITLFAPALFAHCPYHTPLLKGLLHSVRYSWYKDHPFLDERMARDDASMDVTCLTTINKKFMDNEYIKLCLDATRNMEYKDVRTFYQSIKFEHSPAGSLDEDHYYDVSLDCLLRQKDEVLKVEYTDCKYLGILYVLLDLCNLSIGGYNRQNDVIALFNTYLRDGPYPALLVASACTGRFKNYVNCKEFFTRIEVTSHSVIRHFIDAVSKLTCYMVAYHKYELGTASKPDPPVNPLHGEGLEYLTPNRLTCLCFFTFAVLGGVDESLLKRHSDGLLNMQKLLVEAVDLLPPPRWVSTSDKKVLQEALNLWRNNAPSPAHEEVTEKLLALLVDKIWEGRRW